jgi:hypothetical protein
MYVLCVLEIGGIRVLKHFDTGYFESCGMPYRRILDPVYDNKKENWRILTDKEMYVIVKKPMIETIRLHRSVFPNLCETAAQ